LTLAAASAAAWMITRTITRPIGEIIGATQRIAEGSFDPVRVSSHDETALLADAVNQMSERLKRINEHKADWTHKIVHEFRNPLQVIFSAQSMLAEKYLGDLNREQTEMLEHIRSNAEKLMDFTNQFLDLAKAQAGMMEYRMKPTDLGSLVARAVEEARMVASRKEISVALSAAPVPQVMADAEKLGQVFSNLLSNAIKYTERGGAVEVALASAQDRARISVKDFGMGIPAEDLPKLFTRFYQAGNAAGSNSKGTGLGLAVVKTFVEGHGGSVSVKSAVGAGSMFTVEIPLAGPGRAKRANPSPAA
jgi:signal transduction histidine kinase